MLSTCDTLAAAFDAGVSLDVSISSTVEHEARSSADARVGGIFKGDRNTMLRSIFQQAHIQAMHFFQTEGAPWVTIQFSYEQFLTGVAVNGDGDANRAGQGTIKGTLPVRAHNCVRCFLHCDNIFAHATHRPNSA